MTQHKHIPEKVGVHEKAATNTGIIHHTDSVNVTFLYYQSNEMSPFASDMFRVQKGGKLICSNGTIERDHHSKAQVK